MKHDTFETWFIEVKDSAIADFGYSIWEIDNFQEKFWKEYFEQGLTSFEAIMQHLKKIFKHHNG